MFNDTVMYNIRYGRTDATEDEVGGGPWANDVMWLLQYRPLRQWGDGRGTMGQDVFVLRARQTVRPLAYDIRVVNL